MAKGKKDFSIKVKIIFSLGVLALFVVGGIFFIRASFNSLTNTYLLKQDAILEMEINIHEALATVFSHEVHFSTTDQETNGNFDERWSDALADYRQSRDMLIVRITTDTGRTLLAELDDLVERFAELGVSLIEARHKIGVKDDALVGELRRKIHAVEERVQDDTALYAEILQLRRHEKDFLLREDPQYRQLVQEQVALLKELVTDTVLVVYLDEYLDTFNQAAELILQQNRDFEEFERYVVQIDALIDDKFQPFIEDQVNRVITRNRYSVYAVVLGLFLGLWLAGLIVRSILRRIDSFNHVTAQIAAGNLEKRVPVDIDDELGKLSASFNTMADQVLTEKSFNKAALSSIGDGLIALDAKKKIIVFNKSAQEITGYTAQEALGKDFDSVVKIVFDGTQRRNTSFIKKVYATKKVQYMKGYSSVITKDGSEIPIDDSAAPILNAEGELEGVVVVFRDVSEERALEREKNMFFNIASHQLRTPLGGIRWNIESILEGDMGKIPRKIKGVLEDMHSSSQRLIQLVGNLLNISRIEQGRTKEEPVVVELSGIFDELEKELQPLAEEGDISMQFIVDKKMPPIFIARREIRDILENLISNGIKYNSQGGKLTVESVFTGNSVKVSVSDTGIGIPEAEQAKIFSRFYRASNVKNSNVDGTGIGLSVAKMFIEKWGGEIWFESEEGVGTVFHIVFPYDKIRPPKN